MLNPEPIKCYSQFIMHTLLENSLLACLIIWHLKVETRRLGSRKKEIRGENKYISAKSIQLDCSYTQFILTCVKRESNPPLNLGRVES